jgi:SAM-dependent methyltransferase
MNASGGGFSEAGLWQLVESGEYLVDLDFWSNLAVQAGGDVLDLGCGIGRVSHYLNRLGHRTTGVDSDPELIEDFNRTRPDGSPPAVAVDARALLAPASPIRGNRYSLIIAPQQLLQILGGAGPRSQLLGSLPELLAPGGRVAFAICEGLPSEPVDYPDVPPDLREVEGRVHASQPVSIETAPDSVTAVRIRRSLAPGGDVAESRDTVTLDRLDRLTIDGELRQAGLVELSSSPIPPTARHMGSTLIVAGPATS